MRTKAHQEVENWALFDGAPSAMYVEKLASLVHHLLSLCRAFVALAAGKDKKGFL